MTHGIPDNIYTPLRSLAYEAEASMREIERLRTALKNSRALANDLSEEKIKLLDHNAKLAVDLNESRTLVTQLREERDSLLRKVAEAGGDCTPPHDKDATIAALTRALDRANASLSTEREKVNKYYAAWQVAHARVENWRKSYRDSADDTLPHGYGPKDDCNCESCKKRFTRADIDFYLPGASVRVYSGGEWKDAKVIEDLGEYVYAEVDTVETLSVLRGDVRNV